MFSCPQWNHHQLQGHQAVPGEQGVQVRVRDGYGGHRQAHQAHQVRQRY